MINQEGSNAQDFPLVRKKIIMLKIYLVVSIVLWATVFQITINWIQNRQYDFIIWICFCLICSALLFVLWVPTSAIIAISYYRPGESEFIQQQILLEQTASYVSCAAAYTLIIVAAQEIRFLHSNEIVQISLQISMLFLIFVFILPVILESFWKVVLPKGLPRNLSCSILKGIIYGLMISIFIECALFQQSYILIAFIIATVVYFLLQQLRRNTIVYDAFMSSYATRLGIAISLYFFLSHGVQSAISGKSESSNALTFTSSPTQKE